MTEASYISPSGKLYRAKPGRKVQPWPERLWSKVDKDGPVHPALGTPCWLWTDSVNKAHGYAQIWYQGRFHRVHRLVYEMLVGQIDGQLDHLCEIKRCCNPVHLEDVTPQINTQRALASHGCSQFRWKKEHRV